MLKNLERGLASARTKTGTVTAGRTSLAGRIALVAVSVLLSLLVLETGLRLLRSGPQGLLHWPNIARERMGNSEDGNAACAYPYDETLGWTLPAGCAQGRYNVGPDGFRRTPATGLLTVPPILATGSSFTLGEEVADDETWPDGLQNMIMRQVVNAGVSGYSLDQSVLRTEALVPRVRPVLAIIGFTPDDVRRTELSVAWSRAKPYFSVSDGRLVLRNVPVPQQAGKAVPLPVAARLFGRSVLADEIVRRLGAHRGWFFDETRALPPGSGETVSCLLMPRLAHLGVPVIVLAQYSRGHWMADAEGKARDFRATRSVLRCAERAGLVALDMAPLLKPEIETRGVDALFRGDHHSAEGNRAVAELIREALVRRNLLPASGDRTGGR